MDARAQAIADAIEDWDGPLVETDVFGTADPEAIVRVVDDFCLEELGARIDDYVFYEVSVGSVHGVRLTDGRCVVVKVHQPRFGIHLPACVAIQRHLAAEGFPFPMPLRGPRRLARGVAIVEVLIDRGEPADAHRPAIRAAMARTLVRLVKWGSHHPEVSRLASPLPRPFSPLYPKPHNRLFDFEATAAGAEWIDDFRLRARQLIDGDAPLVLGHGDWSVKNMRFEHDEVVAVFDIDSLFRAPEAFAVGDAARQFSATWYLDVPPVPPLEELDSFVESYERARGQSFSPYDRAQIAAAAVYGLAYTARCEHARARDDAMELGSFRWALRD